MATTIIKNFVGGGFKITGTAMCEND